MYYAERKLLLESESGDFCKINHSILCKGRIETNRFQTEWKHTDLRRRCFCDQELCRKIKKRNRDQR